MNISSTYVLCNVVNLDEARIFRNTFVYNYI